MAHPPSPVTPFTPPTTRTLVDGNEAAMAPERRFSTKLRSIPDSTSLARQPAPFEGAAAGTSAADSSVVDFCPASNPFITNVPQVQDQALKPPAVPIPQMGSWRTLSESPARSAPALTLQVPLQPASAPPPVAAITQYATSPALPPPPSASAASAATPPSDISRMRSAMAEMERLLQEVAVKLETMGPLLKDDGSLLKRVQDLKAAFIRHRGVLERLIDGAESSVAANRKAEVTPEAWAVAAQLILSEIQSHLTTTSTKLTKWQHARLSFSSLRSKRAKLSAILDEVHKCWMDLMVEHSVVLAHSSQTAAEKSYVQVAKLALATGNPDWDQLDLTDAQKIHLQADKYLLGQGFERNYEAAHRRYMIAAQSGLAESALMLGFMHENGLGRERDMTSAIPYYRAAAQAGNADAMLRLGKLYETGTTVGENKALAEDYYRSAAGLGHAEAMFRMGRMKELVGDYKAALDLFRAAAERGSAQAENALGTMHFHGRALDQDHAQAVQCFRRAAAQGDAEAANNLGVCYECQIGVQRDFSSAKHYYRAAAEIAGLESAYCNLGRLLLQEEQFEQALQYLHVAASKGSSEAYYHLGSIMDGVGYLEDTNGSIARKDPKVALRYLQKASDRGVASAQVRLGDMFCTGRGVPRDQSRALALYQAAASADNVEGMDRLGRMHELGLGTKVDLRAAVQWYKRSASKGHMDAYLHLAAFWEGQGDLEKATQVYMEAERRGSRFAQSKIRELKETIAEDSDSEMGVHASEFV